VNRRINHPKFKNISSGKAQLELADKDIGDYIFRPSSKGENNITLTWKFYVNNIVHIDIKEENKPIGASIGNTLMIHDEKFENLQEIVERYIIPCNRGLREVINHGKFVACTTEAELAQILKNEKNEDVNRIPYKFTILSDYP
jgi:transcription elongation factor SPT6